MHSSARVLLLALLLAAQRASGSDIEPRLLQREKGDSFEIFVVTFPDTALKCYLVTPLNARIDILASENLSEKYENDPNLISTCRVQVKDLDENDDGLWSLHAVLPSNDDELISQVKLSIKGSETVETSVSSEESSKLSEEDTLNSPEETADSEAVSSEIIEEDNNPLSAENPATSLEKESFGSETVETSVSSEESSKLSEEDTLNSPEETADSETVSSEIIEEDNNPLSAENPATSLEKESFEASSSEEKDVVETEWLSDLRYITRTGLNVDINLPPTQNTEKCTLMKPDGTTVDVEDGIPGVTAHSASEYVSCRVVVGPMEDKLLGKWVLCGSHEENNVEHRRCQNADIVWRSTSSPGSMWDTRIQAKFDHVVHYGSTLTPAVQGSGSVVSCHLVTPDDEDLFLTRDREYPNLRLVQDTDSACSVAIGPIAASHLGDWTVYGTFNSVFGYNEVRLPINMQLYNEDDPYEQAYNVTTLNPSQHVINLGSTIPVEVTGTGSVDSCQFTMPSGQTYLSTGTVPTGVSFVNNNRVACALSIGPITENMIGTWLLIGKFSNRDVYTENRLSFTIIQEDPSNPIQDDRTVQNLDEQLLDTSIGASHRLVIASDIFSTFQSCHIRTPEGLQYTIMEGFNIPGLQVESGSNIFCGVTVQVTEDHIGTWTLISREMRSSQAIERRLPFTIYVEESVEAVPTEITITEGNSIHVRLAKATDLHDTCRLTDPTDQQVSATADSNNLETCGFVVSSVDASHSGTWNIVYGTKIVYKASVMVNVNARVDPDALHLTWVEHASVSQTIGPEEAVYCRVVSPRGVVEFDDFGRCKLAVDRVLVDQHDGVWIMVVGFPGRIVTENHLFEVTVTKAANKPTVVSSVSTNKPIVELTCSVTSAQQKTGCLFRGPSGEVLIANQGVSEGRYVFHVSQTSNESDGYHYSCSLQITEPLTSDLGLWRCDLESEEEYYYGFLTMLYPWEMQDPVVAESIVAEPVLTATTQAVSVEEREPAAMSCSARAPLRYCYFRAPNGTIFNVQPGMSSATVEYAGAGLDAGECGLRVRSVAPGDAGQWACHASLDGLEQSRSISVSVQEEFILRSYRFRERLVVEGRVGGNRSLEYCRFVRFDGLGFTSDKPPFPYVDESDLSAGLCRLRVVFSAQDLNPWTVVAKLQGRDGEVSRVTGHNWPGPPPIYYNPLYMWLPILMILAGCLLLAGAFAPAKNRRWAAERASSMRASMRASMRRWPSLRKTPTTDTNPAA